MTFVPNWVPGRNPQTYKKYIGCVKRLKIGDQIIIDKQKFYFLKLEMQNLLGIEGNLPKIIFCNKIQYSMYPNYLYKDYIEKKELQNLRKLIKFNVREMGASYISYNQSISKIIKYSPPLKKTASKKTTTKKKS